MGPRGTETGTLEIKVHRHGGRWMRDLEAYVFRRGSDVDITAPQTFELLEIPSVLAGLCAIRDSTARVGKHALLSLRFKRMSALEL